MYSIQVEGFDACDDSPWSDGVLMTSDDVPTVVFAGSYEEAMFLKTLIESAGIETSFDGLPIRGRMPFESKVYVRRVDAERATELVADCRANGHRTK